MSDRAATRIASAETPLQGFIERRFYRRKYEARRALEPFSAKLRDETDLEALNNELVGVVRETMQPVHLSMWLRLEGPRRTSRRTHNGFLWGRKLYETKDKRRTWNAYAERQKGGLLRLRGRSHRHPRQPLLIAFFALQASHPEDGTSLGSASDIAGSLSTAFMIPVALALAGRLPRRRATRLTHAAGLAAMALLTVGGPLLVLGVLAFEVETPIAMAAVIILSVWLLLVNRWLRLTYALPAGVARFGEILGAGTLAGYVVVGLGLLLPWMSWPQLVVFGAGVFIGLSVWLCIPVWFLLLGRHLETSS